jgi:exopolysaccharide biosynthesis protein
MVPSGPMTRMCQRGRAWRAAALLVVLAGCHSHCGSRMSAGPAVWRAIADGLEYRYFKDEGTQYHAVRVDLSRLTLRIATARPAPVAEAPIGELVTRSAAIAGVNGTFFDEGKHPLGWLVSEGATIARIHDKDWFAALLIREVGDRRWAEVQPTEAIKAFSDEELRTVRFAIQVGPRTVTRERPVKLKNQRAARTAACVVNDSEIILLVTHGADVESNELAAIMARPATTGGFGCRDGLMFDGGPSSQMAIRTAALNVDVAGGWSVPNGVVVLPRKEQPPNRP